MTSRIPKLLAVLLVATLTACHSGVKLNEGANATGNSGGISQ